MNVNVKSQSQNSFTKLTQYYNEHPIIKITPY